MSRQADHLWRGKKLSSASREPVIVHFSTLSSLNEPFVKLVQPKPPWWENWPRLIGHSFRISHRIWHLGERFGVWEWLLNLYSNQVIRKA